MRSPGPDPVAMQQVIDFYRKNRREFDLMREVFKSQYKCPRCDGYLEAHVAGARWAMHYECPECWICYSLEPAAVIIPGTGRTRKIHRLARGRNFIGGNDGSRFRSTHA
jgi:hypothetical protein